MSITIQYTSRTKPRVPFARILIDIMGKEYDLSLVFVGDRRSRALNKTYRNKTYIPNVLSFPLDKNTGEIYINPRQAAKEAPKFHMTTEGFIGYLFIHGLLHLVGHAHSDTMEKLELRYVKRYGLG